MLGLPLGIGTSHLLLPSGTLAADPQLSVLCKKAPFILVGAFSTFGAFAP